MEASETQTNNSWLALSQCLAAGVERVSSSVVAIDARPRVRTSGVVWRPGIVVSTDHTIRRDEEITVTLGDGRSLPAALVGRDAGTDLAVLRVEDGDAASEQGSAQISDAAELRVGHVVLAVGRPDPERGVSASFGIISLLGDKWRTWRGGEIDRLIRLDLAIHLGFSGGALIDAEGRVLGINTSALARGAGLTIPASTVDRVVDALLTRGRIARPYLGVGMHPVALPESLRSRLKLTAPSGLIMLSVEPDGPADKAGVTLGDVLIALHDAPTADTDDVQAALGGCEVGQEVKAKIVRGGEVKELTIRLGERPGRSR
ncbi:MAG: trypsin-like peptidase domain-containing protein [Pyrinomonadaceae bacterium]|nr:trypsin-like peptidase domain-containing protein [Pyrinomonadaceae bacterium]